MAETATLYIDGAARGNPGPAAYAVVLSRPGFPVVEEAQSIGSTTNNVAEYTALIKGLGLATQLGVKKLAVFSDSELLVKQMNGEYRVKSEDLRPLYEQARQLAAQFDSFRITHIPREQNKRADQLGNKALDGQARQRGVPPATLPRPIQPKEVVTDAAVRDDALAVLRSAAKAWATNGLPAVAVEAVWEQLWSVLAEAGVLKKQKAK
jgi:ribonuclease HI